jgi:hypothetical protein
LSQKEKKKKQKIIKEPNEILELESMKNEKKIS